jgi:hypothetical protein
MTWCPVCRTYHIPLAVPCPPLLACPDCGGIAGCRWFCARFAENLAALEAAGEET